MSQRIELKLGSKNPKVFNIPEIKDIPSSLFNESIIMFGATKSDDTSVRLMFGVGFVVRVSKGEKFDLVYMRFGTDRKNRQIWVVDNIARRQIYTLKKGQVAMLYGYGKIREWKVKGEDGSIQTRRKYLLYALGFQGWYVPRTIEIKHDLINNEDVVPMTDTEINVDDYIDMFKEKE